MSRHVLPRGFLVRSTSKNMIEGMESRTVEARHRANDEKFSPVTL